MFECWTCFFLHYQLILVCVEGGKRWNGTSIQIVKNGDMDISFCFIAQKSKIVVVKCKLCSGQKLYYTANTTLALCRHLHRQYANAKIILCVHIRIGICVCLCCCSLSFILLTGGSADMWRFTHRLQQDALSTGETGRTKMMSCWWSKGQNSSLKLLWGTQFIWHVNCLPFCKSHCFSKTTFVKV